MRTVLAAVGLLLLVGVSPAVAGPCGDDDSDDSDSDDSSGDFSDTESVPTCVEVSGVVGRQQCGSFGGWDAAKLPRLQWSFGFSTHRFSTAGYDFRGTAEHDDSSIAYRVPVEDSFSDPLATAAAFDLRVTSALGRLGYFGVEGSIGGAALVSPTETAAPGGLTLSPAGNAIYASGGAVIGIGASVGDVVVRAEAFAGYRSLGLPVTSYHDDCVHDSVSLAGQWLIQPRVAVEYWARPWITLGAWVGSDSLDTDGFSAYGTSGGVLLSGHLRAFDAGRHR